VQVHLASPVSCSPFYFPLSWVMLPHRGGVPAAEGVRADEQQFPELIPQQPHARRVPRTRRR
jgi:hypothetical protein